MKNCNDIVLVPRHPSELNVPRTRVKNLSSNNCKIYSSLFYINFYLSAIRTTKTGKVSYDGKRNIEIYSKIDWCNVSDALSNC